MNSYPAGSRGGLLLPYELEKDFPGSTGSEIVPFPPMCADNRPPPSAAAPSCFPASPPSSPSYLEKSDLRDLFALRYY